MPTPDLTTLSEAELAELTVIELTELLEEPIATIGWFDLLSFGRKGALRTTVVSKRYTLKGIDDQNFALEGTNDKNFILKGADDQNFALIGS